MFRLSGLFPNCLYLIICLIIDFQKINNTKGTKQTCGKGSGAFVSPHL